MQNFTKFLALGTREPKNKNEYRNLNNNPEFQHFNVFYSSTVRLQTLVFQQLKS